MTFGKRCFSPVLYHMQLVQLPLSLQLLPAFVMEDKQAFNKKTATFNFKWRRLAFVDLAILTSNRPVYSAIADLSRLECFEPLASSAFSNSLIKSALVFIELHF